jgi:hypothetical protein
MRHPWGDLEIGWRDRCITLVLDRSGAVFDPDCVRRQLLDTRWARAATEWGAHISEAARRDNPLDALRAADCSDGANPRFLLLRPGITIDQESNDAEHDVRNATFQLKWPTVV